MRQTFQVILAAVVVIGFLVLISIVHKKKIEYTVNDTMLVDAPFCTDSIDCALMHDLETLAEYAPKKIKYIVVHCTAAPPSVTFTPQTLMDVFKNRWGKDARPGYHYFVDKAGLLHSLWTLDGNPYIEYNEIVWGAKGYNSESVHIAYDGGVDKNMRPKDTRTLDQKRALSQFMITAKLIWPDAEIIGHWRIANPPKDCPSFDAKKEYSL